MRLQRLRKSLATLRRVLSQFSEERRVVLVVATSPWQNTELRVLAIEHDWHLVFAWSLNSAVELRNKLRVAVVLFDQDLPEAEWRRGFRRILESAEPACMILMSREPSDLLRRAVLECGGYDITAKPFRREILARLVDGAMGLAQDTDEVALEGIRSAPALITR